MSNTKVAPAPIHGREVEQAESAPLHGRGDDEQTHGSTRRLTREATKRLFKVTPVTEYSSLLKLLSQPLQVSIIQPNQYFRASNELVVLLLIVCWTITLIFNPDQAIHHPARDYVGHMNPCFGWDQPPAAYIAVLGSGMDVYLSVRYAILEATRTRLLDQDANPSWAEAFATITAYAHGFAALLWLLLWSVGPPDGRWDWHLAIFSFAIGCRYLCSLGNYIENRFSDDESQRKRVTRHHTIFIATCTAARLERTQPQALTCLPTSLA